MWTRTELNEISERATFESGTAGVSKDWHDACVDLIKAAEGLDNITAEIEAGRRSACAIPQLASEEQTNESSRRQK